jgi:hypothetical protein
VNNEDESLGVALYQRELYAITGTLAEFILDYAAYDPTFSREPDAASFRGGVLTVTQLNVPQFLRAMKARPLTPQEATSWSDSTGAGPDVLAFIDFDSRRFVHSYYDLPLEQYVPKGWHAALGNPHEEIRSWCSKK